MTGEIFNIQKFCVNDGPGIRTTVFFKGCPLSCVWCHNPESRSVKKQILCYPDKCVGCGRCAHLTVDTPDFFCPNGAKEICGRTVSTDEVIAEVMKDKTFYENSGGGMTLSGGEPLFQPEFALELLQKAKKEGLHTAIETCGFAAKDTLRKIAAYTDLFLFDFKESVPALHQQFTGVDNRVILENLKLLDELGKDIVLRCPIIPGYNARPDHYAAIARVAEKFNHIIGVDIEPYHSLGEGKYRALGKDVPEITMPVKEEVDTVIADIQCKTSVPVRKG